MFSYMNDFMAVKVPKTNWNQAESVAWYTMEAVSSGIVQVSSHSPSRPFANELQLLDLP